MTDIIEGLNVPSITKAIAQVVGDSAKKMILTTPGKIQRVVEEVGGKTISIFRSAKDSIIKEDPVLFEGFEESVFKPIEEERLLVAEPTQKAKLIVGSSVISAPIVASAVAIGVPAGLANKQNQEFPFLEKDKIKKYLPLMKARQTAVKNRGNNGFTTIYLRKGITKERLRNIQVGNSILHAERYNWLKLNEKRLKDKNMQFLENGEPSNLHLTAISYAYSPVPNKI